MSQRAEVFRPIFPMHQAPDEQRQAGREDRLRRLIEHHGPRIRRVASRILGDEHLAEDAAQEVFLRFARESDRLQSHPDAGGWLFVTARNVALGMRRARLRRNHRELQLATLEDGTTPTAPEVLEWVDEAISRLPEEDRVLLLERFVDERSHRDLGQSRGLSEDAARMRVARALDRLKQILESLGPALVPPALSALLDAWGGDFRSAPRCGTFRLPTEGFGKVSSLARYVKGGLIGFGTLALIGVGTLKARQGLTFGETGLTESASPPQEAASRGRTGSSEAPATRTTAIPPVSRPGAKAEATSEPDASIRKARERVEAREFAEARDLLREVLRRFPGSAEARFVLGNAHEGLGDLESAERDFDQVLELQPEAAANWHARARIRDRRDRFAEGLGDCDRAIRLSPEFWPAHLVRGRCLLGLRRLGEAETAFVEAARFKSDWMETLELLGDTQLRLLRYAAAEETWKRAVALQKNGARYHLGLARAHSGQGEHAEAIAEFERTLEIDPDSIRALLDLGLVRMELKQWEKADQDLTQVIRVEPQNAYAHCNRAQVRLELGRLPAALADIDRAVRLAPDWGNYHFHRGKILGALERHEEAMEALKAALGLDPSLFSEVWEARGDIEFARRQLAAAESDYTRALAEPDSRILFHRGQVRMERDNPTGALDDFDASARLEPGSSGTQVQRGRTLARLGRPAEARAAFDRAVQLGPSWPFAFENRGAFRHFERDLDGAAADFLRAIELAPSAAYPRQMLARVRFEQGRRDEALRLVDEAIRLAPQDASLPELRKSLQESPIPTPSKKTP